MARISYPSTERLHAPDIAHHLELARTRGAPRPESQAVRAHVPAILDTFSATWEAAFYGGELDHRVKELARMYVAKTVECAYCSGQRSELARDQGLGEQELDDLLRYESSTRLSDREKAALAYTDAIVWDQTMADDTLWQRLHQHFTEAELVELGYFVALTSGQQRWIRTLGLEHLEVLADTQAGLVD
ncbi:carboxymuconolactone decarboxylase family protein [Phytoactinopolyspora limicola]|uniref:carboxymuconolactone decarboxylase family protein n=1 Tax=Phytoactinopolyspora limicola TaxID=2715536 RepID=UPI00140A5976|nr:carboxymuconolactone decarboxylase family protein [Phytoactinopolyspora limicola]